MPCLCPNGSRLTRAAKRLLNVKASTNPTNDYGRYLGPQTRCLVQPLVIWRVPHALLWHPSLTSRQTPLLRLS